jgi:hypothetical protein
MTDTAQQTKAVPDARSDAGERDRDPARAALRDLVVLASQCALRENEIEHEHRSVLETAEQELAKAKSNLDLRAKSVREELQQKYTSRVEEINQRFQTDLAELKKTDTSRRRRRRKGRRTICFKPRAPRPSGI